MKRTMNLLLMLFFGQCLSFSMGCGAFKIFRLAYLPTGSLPSGLGHGQPVAIDVRDDRTIRRFFFEESNVNPEEQHLRPPARDLIDEGMRKALESSGFQVKPDAPIVYHIVLNNFELHVNRGFGAISAKGFVNFDVTIESSHKKLLTRTIAETASERIMTGPDVDYWGVVERVLATCLSQSIERTVQTPEILSAVLRDTAGAVVQNVPIINGDVGRKVAGLMPDTKIGQRYAVIVGITKYKSAGEKLETLQYADKDAKTFRDFLVSPAGGSFPPSNVLLLTNEQATTAEVRRGLFSFLKSAIKEDLVVVFFSGHGAADPDRPDNLYLLTYDTDPTDIAATAFPMDDVRKAMEKTIEAQRVVVLADACHSGGVAHEMKTKGVQIGSLNESMTKYWSQLSQTGPGRVIFTSSERGEVSQESGKWGDGHGVFTWALLDGLKGAADADKDGIVTLGEALRYTDEKVRRETKSAQHPTVAGEQYDPNLPMGVVK